MNMTSETTPLTPPPLVRIVCSPYDSDNEDEFAGGATSPNSSFINPSSERKKARARGGSNKIKFLDEISRNAAGFGQSMAVHANHTLQRLVAPETDNRESDGYDSDDDSQRRWRKSKLDMLMVKALDKADMYAAALCNVADHVPTGCIGNGFICGDDDYSDDDSWSSYEEDTPRRERRSRTKKSKRTKSQLIKPFCQTQLMNRNKEVKIWFILSGRRDQLWSFFVLLSSGTLFFYLGEN